MLDDDSEDINNPLDIPGISQQLPIERSIETRYREEDELKQEITSTSAIDNLAPHDGLNEGEVGDAERN